MRLLNIHNSGRTVYLFGRDSAGEQVILTDDSFFPFYYEIDKTGNDMSYDGLTLRKVFTSTPQEIPKQRSITSYSSDIPFVKNYLIHKIEKIDKTAIKWLFLDIEVLAPELPTYTNPQYPISCITIYNSFSKETKTWFLGDYKNNEKKLLSDFINYIQHEKPDLILAWNMDNFDYPYLYTRYKAVIGKDFAKDMSPIKQARYSQTEDIFYPAGISILDYLKMFKKVFMREASYALDFIAQKHLSEESIGTTVFKNLTVDVKNKNIKDISRMVKLEDKYQIISYFNEIRLLTKALWEDLCFNSFIIEMLLFEEAKKQHIVLPNKRNNAETTFEGATRECIETGALFDIGKFDLTSAYPNMVINFCLDSQNITPRNKATSSYVEINGIFFNQNPNALLPSLIKKLLTLKDTLKKEVKKYSPDTEEYKKAQTKYDAIKGVVNSAFGVMGFPGFRIYDNNIASTIAYLVRDLLMTVKDKVEKEGYKVVYWDTDSVFIKTTEDITEKLNQYLQDWAKQKYKILKLSVEFEYEGYFEKVFLLTKCRYYGYIKTPKGIKKEIKGMEIKRSSSSKYESNFQAKLLDKILNRETYGEILKWVEEEIERIKTLPLEQIAFPCKIGQREYKNDPIFLRAYRNTQKIIPTFKMEKGELFYYIYIKSANPENNVLAFTESIKDKIPLNLVDYDEIIRRNIKMKTQTIFDVLGWKLLDSRQMVLF